MLFTGKIQEKSQQKDRRANYQESTNGFSILKFSIFTSRSIMIEINGPEYHFRPPTPILSELALYLDHVW